MSREVGGIHMRDLERNPGTNQCPEIQLIGLDTIGDLSSWSRVQKNRLGIFRHILSFVLHVALYTVEAFSLISILLSGAWLHVNYTNDVETCLSLALWILCIVLSTIVKFMNDAGMMERKTCCSKVWTAIENILLPVKLFRYVRHFQYRQTKLRKLRKILDSRISVIADEGRAVEREQLAKLVKVARNELIDAQYDLYETFLQSMPMALLQNYFLFYAQTEFHLCNYRDVFRLLLVVVHLISAARSAAAFDWAYKEYQKTLFIENHLMSSRYSIRNVFNQDDFSHGLNVLCHFFSILSRFYLVSFFSAVSAFLGMACFVLLFGCNWLLVYCFSSLKLTVQNLPVGVSQNVASFVDRWINTFTSKGTRFFELSRGTPCCKSRFPLVFTQVPTFFTPFFVLMFGLWVFSPSLFEEASMSIKHQNGVVNGTIHCYTMQGYDGEIGIFRVVSDTIRFVQTGMNTRFTTYMSIYNILHLQWLLLYLEILAALIYTFYISRMRLNFDGFPPYLAAKFLRVLFHKVVDAEYAQPSMKMVKVKRLLYLLSLSLDHFDTTYHDYKQRAHDQVVKDWWDSRIRNVIRTVRSGDQVDLQGSPLAAEYASASAVVEEDIVGQRMLTLSARMLDTVISREMTSTRLERTFEMFRIPKSEMFG